MTTLTIEQRIGQAQAALDEGRIIQNRWRRPADESGREFVCALAAFGPDINSAADCPADLMPPWLASLIPTLDDGIAAADVPWFMGELLARARRWQSLDHAAWERVRVGFMVRSLQQAQFNDSAAAPPLFLFWAAAVHLKGIMFMDDQANVTSESDERTINNVENAVRHAYRVLTDKEKQLMVEVKNLGHALLERIASIGSSRELSIARTKAEEAVMWAVKHITA